MLKRPGTCANEYTLTRTFIATDACGNTATASQTITVTDNTAPVFTSVPAAATIECPLTPSFGTANSKRCMWYGEHYNK